MKKYIYKYKGLFTLNLILIVAVAFANVFLAFTFRDIVDIGTQGTINDLKRGIWSFLLYVIVFIIVLGYLQKFFQARYIKKTMISLKDDIFTRILRKNIKSFNEENSAQYISTLTNDMNIIEQDYFINIQDLIFNIASFIIATVAIIKLNLYITLSVFGISILSIAIPIIFGKSIGGRKKLYSDSLGLFTSKVKDMFTGFEVVKSFNIEKKISHEYKKANYETENYKYKFTLLSAFVEILSTVAGFMMFVAAFGIGTYFIIKGKMTVGSMIAAVQLMNNIVNPIIMVSSRVNKLKSVKLINNKIIGILGNEDKADKGLEKNNFKESITFKNVEFSYSEEKKALHGVSLSLDKGKKYAVVGGSGCGKSTLLKLLLRYYEDYRGSIEIDGTDSREIKVDSLYKLLSVIQQNVFMFDSSVKENITLFKEYREEDIERAIKLSGLETLVNSLPKNIESNVGENGSKLSGGEKQRIAIARALIRKTPILVLDEATSALDNETSYNIEKSLLGIEDLTCIVVTHKLIDDMLKKYDGIVVMKNGQIEEVGTFYELMNRKGYFYSLYNVTKEAA